MTTPFMSPEQISCNGMASLFSPNFLLQMDTTQEDEQHHHLQHVINTANPSFFPANNAQDLRAMLFGNKSKPTSSLANDAACDDGGDEELSDECVHGGGEKKRRLSVEQVRMLEKNFELGNKLEPERKMQLAKALGLRPRQVAIWFQNRRARWKTKQLEKDYDVLKRQFQALKSENDALHAHNKKLQAQVAALKGSNENTEPINLSKESDGCRSNRSQNSAEIVNLNNSSSSKMSATVAMESRPMLTTAFPPMRPPTLMNMTQLLQRGGDSQPEENFCNAFAGGVDGQPPFWVAWSDQQRGFN